MSRNMYRGIGIIVLLLGLGVALLVIDNKNTDHESDKNASDYGISEAEFALWKQFSAVPPPEEVTDAKLADNTFRLWEKRNTTYVDIELETTPKFSSSWIPDDAYRYYFALTGLCSGENLIGVGRLKPAETARAKEMLEAFKDAWAPHTKIKSFGLSGVYSPEHDHKAEFDMDQAYKKRVRELQDKFGITPHRGTEVGGWSFDVDIMRSILAYIRKKSG